MWKGIKDILPWNLRTNDMFGNSCWKQFMAADMLPSSEIKLTRCKFRLLYLQIMRLYPTFSSLYNKLMTLSHFFVHVCMYVWTHMSAHICRIMCTCAYMHVEERDYNWASASISVQFHFVLIASPTWSWTWWFLGSKLYRASCLFS